MVEMGSQLYLSNSYVEVASQNLKGPANDLYSQLCLELKAWDIVAAKLLYIVGSYMHPYNKTIEQYLGWQRIMEADLLWIMDSV